jgi:hypothetical protein
VRVAFEVDDPLVFIGLSMDFWLQQEGVFYLNGERLAHVFGKEGRHAMQYSEYPLNPVAIDCLRPGRTVLAAEITGGDVAGFDVGLDAVLGPAE